MADDANAGRPKGQDVELNDAEIDAYRRAMRFEAFSDDAKDVLASRLRAAIHSAREQSSSIRADVAAECHQGDYHALREDASEKGLGRDAQSGLVGLDKGGITRRVICALVLAAALVLGVSAAIAGTTRISSEELYERIYGHRANDARVIDAIGGFVEASSSSGGYTLSVDSAIVDREHVVVVCTLTCDDEKAFDGIEPYDDADNLMPIAFESFSMVVGPNNRPIAYGGQVCCYDSDVNDASIQVVAIASAGNGALDAGIESGMPVRIYANRLLHYLSPSESCVLSEGEWLIDFTVDFTDTAIACAVGTVFELEGARATVDAMFISPLALSMTCKVDILDYGASFDQHSLGKMVLHMKDGSTLEEDFAHAGGGYDALSPESGMLYANLMFPHAVVVGDVVSVEVCGIAIPVAE